MLLPIVLLFLTLARDATTRVVLKNNGYRNLIVAIGESVRESGQLLNDIESTFTKASAYLYTATKRRAYFRDITILVPESWRTSSLYGKPSGSESFDNAEIRIDQPAYPGDDRAYVLSRGSVCGMEGDYMHVTPGRLTEYQDVSPAEKMIVHEWAHLRWGVFDEYGVGDDIAYLNEEGKTEGTGCSVEFSKTGRVLDDGGRKCSAFSLSPSCRLETDSNIKTKGSIMFRQYIDSVDSFCEDDGDDSTRHNMEAPNFQNTFCNYRSTWSVIQSHEDFRDGANPPGSPDQNTKPRFRYVHTGNHFENFVFVLDLSLSMALGGKMDRLRQAAHLYIATATPGSQIGIVTLQTKGAIRLPLRAIWNITDRQILSRALPTKSEANGHTGIGSGLLKAVELLTGFRDIDENFNVDEIPRVGGSVIVISDGEENEKPLIQQIKPLLEAAGIMVHSVGLGPLASERLGKLSEDTSGMIFYTEKDGSEANTQMLNEALMTVSDMTSRSSANSLGQIASDVHVLEPGARARERFMIDFGMGRETTFVVMWNVTLLKNESPVEVKLISPSGIMTNSANKSMYSIDKTFNTIQINLPSMAQSGWWEYEIINPSKGVLQQVTVSASTRRAPSNQADSTPLTLTTFTSAMFTEYPQPVLITARLMTGYRAIVKANVTAEITRPNADRVEITLKDDGIAPDMTANDGVYVAYFAEYTSNGRYNVIVRASSDGAALAVSVLRRDDVAIDELVRREPPPSPKRLSAFMRVRAAGAFQLDGYEGKDLMGPARVMDLKVLGTSLMTATVRIQWSAPGDDAYTGKVASFDVRISPNFTRLMRDFSSAFRISSSDIVGGSLGPLLAGERQEVTIRVPNGTWPYFVAIKSTDLAGNPSELSNIAQFMLSDSESTSGVPALTSHLIVMLFSLLCELFW